MTKLGVVALAGPDNGGTYQYTLAMLHGLQHVRGFDITLFGEAAQDSFVCSKIDTQAPSDGQVAIEFRKEAHRATSETGHGWAMERSPSVSSFA